MYFVSQYITLEVQQTVVVVFGVWGIISVMVLDRFVWRLTPPKQMKLAGMLNFARKFEICVCELKFFCFFFCLRKY